ncbi:unnamed protein product [Mytilus edulis]|uniref:Fibronectin type-III domain-containing protein n=1 Tax=Mytilus edulis TaxID=6550 RepID=A0A8S3QIP1_MYTED|nr:unnamed protein product [Mytilus edulis]
MEESDALAETHDGHIAGQNTQDINCYPSSRLINSLVQMDKPSCLTIAPNTIKVRWHKCRVSDESLKSYEIIYKKVESELWETAFTDAIFREKDFSNLKEDTKYHFKVRAIFTNSESPYSEISDPVSTSVNRRESSTSSGSCISGQQENSPTTCDDETVDLEHDTYVPVIEDCKSIGKPSFEIRYKPTIETAKRWHSKFTKGKECEIDIVNLVEETNYCFKVRSIYDDVEGPFSDISDPVSTLQISLDLQLNVPGKPMAENITPVSISLKWISPVKTTGAIDCYEIKYKEADTVNKRWISLWTKRN